MRRDQSDLFAIEGEMLPPFDGFDTLPG